MIATRLPGWMTVVSFLALSCGGQKPQSVSNAQHQAGRAAQTPIRVLVLADVDTPGTAALIGALSAAGYQVTERPPPEFTYDGVTPSPNDFDCIIHLDSTSDTSLPVATQQALEAWVNQGGGFIAAQWDGFEWKMGTQTAMPNLTLQGWGGAQSNNCTGCQMTWTADPSQLGHPVLAGLPQPLVFRAEGHDSGPQVPFGDQPSTVLMRAPKGGPAVLAREFGLGHVVQIALAPNNLDGSSLQDANIQKLYVNAVAWAGVPTKPPQTVVANAGVDQSLEATGPLTGVVLDGSASAPPDASYFWIEGDVTLASTQVAAVDLGVGVHVIQLLVMDAAGNSASATVSVTVVDDKPPALKLPDPIIAEAAGPAGASVTFAAGATDLVDGAVPASCTPASGSVFALGSTTVSCSAADKQGNSSSGSFTVTVRDSIAPVVQVSADITAIATSAAGASVTFNVSATDTVDGSVAATCAPASGSVMPPGSTAVTCTAADASGNQSAPAVFHVSVQFAWSGLLFPVNANGSSVFEDNAIVPVRFKLTSASAPITNLVSHLYLAPMTGGVLGPLQPAAGLRLERGRAVRSNVFQFAAGNYLLLTPLRGLPAGRWALVVDLGDGVQHVAPFTIASHRGHHDGHDED